MWIVSHGTIEMTQGVSTERGEAQSQGTPKLRAHGREEDPGPSDPPNYLKMNHGSDPVSTAEKASGSV